MQDLDGLETFSKDQFLDFADAYEEVDKRSVSEIDVDPDKRLAWGIPVGQYVSQDGKTHSVIYLYKNPRLSDIEFDIMITHGKPMPMSEWLQEKETKRLFITFDYEV